MNNDQVVKAIQVAQRSDCEHESHELALSLAFGLIHRLEAELQLANALLELRDEYFRNALKEKWTR